MFMSGLDWDGTCGEREREQERRKKHRLIAWTQRILSLPRDTWAHLKGKNTSCCSNEKNYLILTNNTGNWLVVN